jgi:hypothetical protein
LRRGQGEQRTIRALLGCRPMSRREMTSIIDLMMRKWGPLVSEAALAFEALRHVLQRLERLLLPVLLQANLGSLAGALATPRLNLAQEFRHVH